jgi:hypothetical protein
MKLARPVLTDAKMHLIYRDNLFLTVLRESRIYLFYDYCVKILSAILRVWEGLKNQSFFDLSQGL